MNLLRLTDAQRIVFLKGIIAGMGVSAAVMLAKAAQTIGVLEKGVQRNRNLAELQHKIILRFSELAPEEANAKIMDEFGFDVVTLNIDL